MLINTDVVKVKNQSTRFRTKSEKVLSFAPLIISAALVPWVIASYPGILGIDSVNQICQFFGVPGYLDKLVNFVNPDVLISQYHPVLHTVFIGLCMKLGVDVFCSSVIGHFIYTLLQCVLVVTVLSYSLRYMKERGVSVAARLATLLFYLVAPIVPSYAVYATKDTLFALALVVLVIATDMIAREGRVTVRGGTMFAIGGFAVSAFRNGCVVIVLITALLLLVRLVRVSDGLRTLALGVGVMSVPMVMYLVMTSVMFPIAEVASGCPNQTLSIPMQQTAAVVKYHGDSLSEEDRSAIDAVFDYDEMSSMYAPSLSDGVKSTYRADATEEDIGVFMCEWVSLFVRYPMTCVEATMRNYYAWLYPSTIDVRNSLYTIHVNQTTDDAIETNGFSDEFDYRIDRNGILADMASAMDGYLRVFDTIPVISLLRSPAIYVWVMLLSLVRAFRCRSSSFVGFVAMLMTFLIVLIGPCNGTYVRYALPIIMCLPMACSLASADCTVRSSLR